MDTTILQISVQKRASLFDPEGQEAAVIFSVRMPHEVYQQRLVVSSLEYKTLLDRCWEVVRDSIMEHYKEEETVALR